MEMLQRHSQRSVRAPQRKRVVGEYQLATYRHRFFDVSEGQGMKVRSLWISVHFQGALIGAAAFSEWKIAWGVDPSEFWWMADGLSLEDGRLAEVLGSFWPHHDWPADYGNVVTFHRLAIDTSNDTGRRGLKVLGDYLHEEFFGRASAILIQAYPLEFEGKLPIGSPRRNVFNRRLAGMMRLYASALGATPFEDQSAYPGWMWILMTTMPLPDATADTKWLEDIR